MKSSTISLIDPNLLSAKLSATKLQAVNSHPDCTICFECLIDLCWFMIIGWSGLLRLTVDLMLSKTIQSDFQEK